MASNITALTPTLFSAAQEVSAEPFGIVDGINTSFDNKGVAKGDKVTVPVAPTQSNTTFDPSNVYPEGSSKTALKVDVEITKSQKNSMVLTGEQIRSLENGSNYQEWTRQWAAQAMRALRNEAEQDAALSVKYGASRGTGTAGTTPFATSLSDLVAVRKILRDNGAPMADLQFVGNSNTEMNLLNLGIVQQAFAAGSDQERRSGFVGRQFGFQIRTSAGIAAHTAGATSTAYQTNAQTAAGLTSIVVKEGASSTIKAGDLFTIADDPAGAVYVAAADVDANTDPLLINRPGLLAVVAASKAIALKGNYTPNLAFERNAVVGIMRPPMIPANPTIKTLPISDQYGMTYLFVEIAQYGQITWEMHLAWGFKVVQPEHVAILAG